jgi:DNA-binding transcriptional MerR regulator
MEMRVEHLAARSGVSVDTVRYYQSKGLLDPPRREGRIAWYDDTHLARLTRIRALQERGFTLATIARLVSGELDAADEALLGELSGLPHSVADGTPGDGGPGAAGADGTVPGEPRTYTLAELATETGIPLALLKAVEAEQLLIPRRVAGLERYTDEDVAAASAALLLLEWGIPLPALLDLARLHHEATVTVARGAIDLFSRFVRDPLRAGGDPGPDVGPATPEDADGTPAGPPVERLLQAYAELLPAVNTLVGHHFTRTLVQAALDHVEQVGTEGERRAIWELIERDGVDEPVLADDEQAAAGR